MKLDLSRWSVARLLVLGLAIREAFSFWTGHPFDFEIWVRNAYYVAHGWTPYASMPAAPGVSFAYTGQSLISVSYLPLWSLLLAGLYQFFTVLPGGNRFVLYFLLKQPPILGDVLLGWLMGVAAGRWGAPQPVARRVLAFWMVFPYPILISAVWGMFDSLVACLVLAALLASAVERRWSLMGLGILLKLLPIIFVPYAIYRTPGRRRWATLLSLAIPLVFTGAVFALTGWSLSGITDTMSWEAHVVPQGLTPLSLLTDPGIVNLAFADPAWIYWIGYLWIPAILVGTWWISRRFRGAGPRDLLQVFLFLTMVLFLFRLQVNEQYLLYLLPLLLLDVVVWHPERRALFHATWLLALAFLIVNNFFLVRFAAPVDPSALAFEFALTADMAFTNARSIILALIAVLFSIDLIQLAAVVVNPRRSTTPWIVVGVRRAWSASGGRLRSRAAGREG